MTRNTEKDEKNNFLVYDSAIWAKCQENIQQCVCDIIGGVLMEAVGVGINMGLVD